MTNREQLIQELEQAPDDLVQTVLDFYRNQNEVEIAMTQQTTPKMPDDATCQRLRASLAKANAELKDFGDEIQEMIDQLEYKYARSTIGQFHARLNDR